MSIGTRDFIYLLLIIPAILTATTIHEFTRALVSALLGDNTPIREKRITLNPLNHFEPIGFLLMYATGTSYGAGCGWGKPVNTNAKLYKNRRLGVVLTAVLPSVANFFLALLASYCLKYTGGISFILTDFFRVVLIYNVYIIVFNFFPVVPFDCLKIVMEFVSRKNYFAFAQSESIMQLIMMLLLFTGMISMFVKPITDLLVTCINILTV